MRTNKAEKLRERVHDFVVDSLDGNAEVVVFKLRRGALSALML